MKTKEYTITFEPTQEQRNRINWLKSSIKGRRGCSKLTVKEVNNILMGELLEYHHEWEKNKDWVREFNYYH